MSALREVLARHVPPVVLGGTAPPVAAGRLRVELLDVRRQNRRRIALSVAAFASIVLGVGGGALAAPRFPFVAAAGVGALAAAAAALVAVRTAREQVVLEMIVGMTDRLDPELLQTAIASLMRTLSQPRRPPPAAVVSVYLSIAREDETLRRRLEVHLAPLRREGFVRLWGEWMISPGEMRAASMTSNFDAADVIILGLSPHHLASDQHADEITRALVRSRDEDTMVIPIVLRPCDWKHGELATLACLPSDETAVALSRDRDEALLEVAQGIRRAVVSLHESRGQSAPSRRAESQAVA